MGNPAWWLRPVIPDRLKQGVCLSEVTLHCDLLHGKAGELFQGLLQGSMSRESQSSASGPKCQGALFRESCICYK